MTEWELIGETGHSGSFWESRLRAWRSVKGALQSRRFLSKRRPTTPDSWGNR